MSDQTTAVETLAAPRAGRKPAAVVPAFAAPVPADPPLPAEAPPADSPAPASPPHRPLSQRLLGGAKTPDRATGGSPHADGPRPAEPIRTDTSAFPGKPSTAETAKLVAGLLGLVVVGAAFAVQLASRRNRTLRRPAPSQIDDVAKPLARIGLRHVDPGLINADLVDAIAAATAMGHYLTEGPLTTPARPVDPGVPDDLQEAPQ